MDLSTTMNLFKLPAQESCKICCCIAHRSLVKSSKFLKGLKGQVFRQILDHSKHAFIQWTSLTCGLEILLQPYEMVRTRVTIALPSTWTYLNSKLHIDWQLDQRGRCAAFLLRWCTNTVALLRRIWLISWRIRQRNIHGRLSKGLMLI